MHAWTEVLETHWTGSPLTEVSSSDHKPSIVKKDAEIGHSRTVTFPFKEQVDNRIVCENTKTLRSALAPLHDVVDRVMDLQAPFPGSLTYPGGSLLDHQVTEIWVPTRRGQTACLPLMSSHSWVTRSLADVPISKLRSWAKSPQLVLARWPVLDGSGAPFDPTRLNWWSQKDLDQTPTPGNVMENAVQV